MHLLEMVFTLIVLGILLAQNVRGVAREYPLALVIAGLATIVLSSVLDQIRWQMAPAYLLFAILALMLLRRSHSHVAIRSTGVLFGLALLSISSFLSHGLPVLTLPAPNGPHMVGSMSFSLFDESRDNSFFGAPDEERELYVQIWYPGTAPEGESEPKARTLWEELYRGDQDLFAAIAGYLRGVNTHSYEGIPLSPSQAPYPVIVFSHAMVSFAEQNTLLMEHLASHGYLVFGISHPYTSMRMNSSSGRAIYPNFEKINEVSAQFRVVSDDVTPRIERAESPEERSRLQLELYERASGNNELMALWVDDLRFTLDSILAPSGRYPKLQPFSSRIDGDQIGLLGMSFGGGAVTELCKVDTRCRAALNMDGPTFGRQQRQPLRAPYLVLMREDQGSLDYLLPTSRSDYYQVRVEGATHLDFTDDALVLPILKWLDMTGSIAGERIIEITNVVSLRFFDAYLRGGPQPRFDDGFPELTVVTSDSAGE